MIEIYHVLHPGKRLLSLCFNLYFMPD
jgi:hypothetical protein